MALIRVTRCLANDPQRQDEAILNTAQIVMVYPDDQRPPRGTWVQLVTGEPVLVCMPFEDLWTFIQRET